MNKKSVIISPSDTGADKVAVQLDLCSYYRGIVESIVIDTTYDDEFQRQVDLVVWGSFFIEAAMNKTIEMIVDDSVQGILEPTDVLDYIERSNVEKKLNSFWISWEKMRSKI